MNLQAFITRPDLPDLEIFASETILLAGNGPIKIVLGSGDVSLDLIMVFATDPKEKPVAIKQTTSEDKKSVTLTLTNWNSALPSSLTDFWEAGSFNKRKLYILFTVQLFGDNEHPIRQIIYNAYLGGPAEASPVRVHNNA